MTGENRIAVCACFMCNCSTILAFLKEKLMCNVYLNLPLNPSGQLTHPPSCEAWSHTRDLGMKSHLFLFFFRCHSVLQAWKTDTCHCVYANRTFTIERDDRQWKKDLEECKKFLIENGY